MVEFPPTDSPLLLAARAFVLKGLELGLANGNQLLTNRPDLAAQLNENPQLAAHEVLSIHGGTILRGVETATMTQVRGTVEFAALQVAMRGDTEVGAVIGQWVATAGYGHTVTAETVAQRLLWRVMSQAGFYADPTLIDEEIARIMAAVVSEVFEVRYVIPIYGLNLSGDLPLVIGQDLVIDVLAPAELSAVTRHGFGYEPGKSPVRQIGPVFGLRRRLDLPRVFGREAPQADRERLGRFQSESEDAAERILSALRLFKQGRLHMPGGVVIAHDNVTDGGWESARPVGSGRARARGPVYAIGGHERDQLAHFITDCEKVHEVTSLNVAIRRFSFAGERVRPEDELVDLMISAEALFLGDLGERGELSYRLSIRAALYIEAEVLTRRQVYDHMRAAYNARSKVAHGSQLKLPKLADGTTMTFDQFAGVTEELLALALHKAVEHFSEHGSFEIDWDDLFFSEIPERTSD